jgi:hypothetical protein
MRFADYPSIESLTTDYEVQQLVAVASYWNNLTNADILHHGAISIEPKPKLAMNRTVATVRIARKHAIKSHSHTGFGSVVRPLTSSRRNNKLLVIASSKGLQHGSLPLNNAPTEHKKSIRNSWFGHKDFIRERVDGLSSRWLRIACAPKYSLLPYEANCPMVDGLTLFDLSVAATHLAHSFGDRSPCFTLGFALACRCVSAYGFLQGPLPCRPVKSVWHMLA